MRVGGNMERFIKELVWFNFLPLVMLEELIRGLLNCIKHLSKRLKFRFTEFLFLWED